MSRIPHTTRRHGRYYFRRRARWQSVCDYTAIIPLKTCDAQEARQRASILAAHFEKVKRAVNLMLAAKRHLEPVMISRLFEDELQQCLERLLTEIYGAANPESEIAVYRTFASAYDVAQRPGARDELTPADRERLAAAGHDEIDIEFVAADLHRFCNAKSVDEEVLAFLAEDWGLEPTDSVIAAMRSPILRGRAEAHRLAAHFLDDDVQGSIDPIATLIQRRRALGEPLSFRRSEPDQEGSTNPSPTAMPPIELARPLEPTAAADECLFMIPDNRRFSEIIDPTIAKMRGQNRWRGDCSQQRRIMRMFAWITGDKPLHSYDFRDVEKFVETLQALPKDFSFAKNQDRAVADVLAELTVTRANRRSNKTVNRDLSFMSTVASDLSKTAWRPKSGTGKIVDFAEVQIKNKRGDQNKRENDRPPWTSMHMELLFSAPVWTGGGAQLRRLKSAQAQEVFHDAAYWVPLLLYYTHATLNEICGLRCDEVGIDAPTPFLRIEDNDVRGKDGELAGEKNAYRRRFIPLHEEILRLGFPAYVNAIRREGHPALFPELYTNAAKRGGAQFYNVAWRQMFIWLEQRTSIPTAPSGKQADMHSIRALGSSYYSQEGVLDHMRADVMGHARSGTNAVHYSKRWETEGRDKVLGEYRKFMERYTTKVTGHLEPSPLRLLHLNHRSRCGAPEKAKSPS